MDLVFIAIVLGLLAVVYGFVTSRQVLSSGAGNEKMQEIAAAIQEGAQAYLKRQYTTIAIVGVTLGITFGSGILMKDVQSGTIPKKDVFGVMCFLNLKHSVFEDTAVVMLFGPSLFVIVILRLGFSVAVTMLMMAIGRQMSPAQWDRYLTNKNIPDHAG